MTKSTPLTLSPDQNLTAAANGSGAKMRQEPVKHRYRKGLSTFFLSAAMAALVGLSASESQAGRKYEPREGTYVAAESKFGNGTVVGPVRQTRVGRQVRTPGGNWLHCARSCAETLRVNTVDYWESETGAGIEAGTDHDGGIFGRLFQFNRRY